MFKERLKIACKKFGYCLLQIFLVILMFTFIGGSIYLVSEFPTLKIIGGYVVYSMISIVALILIWYVVEHTYKFIQWLFVEPYREKKKMK